MTAARIQSRSTQRKLGLAGGALMVLLASSLAHGQGAANKAAVVSIDGDASGLEYRYGPQGNWTASQGKEELGVGMELRTKARRISIKTSDGASITLLPETTLIVRQLMNLNLDPSVTTRTQRFDITRGRITVRMGATPTRAVLVAASNDRYAAIQQGSAAVSLSAAGMAVTMDQGSARVASSGAWVQVSSQQFVLLEQSKKPSASSLPAAPRYLEQVCQPTAEQACGIALVSGEERAKLGARWQGLAGVSGYEVRIAKDSAMREIIDESSVGPQTSYVTAPLEAGRYWFSVRGTWSNGTQSAYSSPKYMRIVKLQFPGGAKLRSNPTSVVLPAGSNCQILDPAGIEASGDGIYFSSAPSTISLTQDATSSAVILRPTGERWESLPVQVTRRTLEARMEFSPRNPRWPQDNLQLTLRLLDPYNRSDPSEISPTVNITINGGPANISLKRKDNEWTTKIPAQVPPGPWVVRVEVLDQWANLIGADFVEIEGPRPTKSKAPGNRVEW